MITNQQHMIEPLTLWFIGSFLLGTVLGLYLISKIAKTSKFQLLGDFVTQIRTSEKVLALTYDDGPNPPYTNQLLDVLDKLQVKATFFVVGQKVEAYPETAKMILDRGHELGNHSYSHKALIFKTPQLIQSEIEKTEQLLYQLGASFPIHFRAPFGYKLLLLPYILAKKKISSILWNVDPKDYAASQATSIENEVLKQIQPGSIVLMHDGGGDRSATITATENLIHQLRDQGYQFKTVSELLAMKN